MGSVCGKLCQKSGGGGGSSGDTSIKSSEIESENEISLPSYKSDADSDFNLIENKFNYLRDLRFNDYFHALCNYSDETATVEENYSNMTYNHTAWDPFYEEAFSIDLFQSFLENKVLKHESLYEKAGENERMTSIFREIMIAACGGLALKLAQDAKSKDENTTIDKNNVLKKKHIIAFGILYCSRQISKVHMIFSLFKATEPEVLVYSDKFAEFLLSIFILASYGVANARNKASKFDEIGPIDTNKLREYVQASELKDCQNLVWIAMKQIFGDDYKGQISYDDFKGRFNKSDSSLGYILSPSGIRDMLKKNNV